MKKRVESEQTLAEDAYNSAKERLDALQEQEMKDLLEMIAEYDEMFRMESIPDLNGGLDTAVDMLKGELEKYIEKRKHIWNKTAEQEEKNAKWQQDSYYRFSLIKLLNVKKARVEAKFNELF